MPNLLPSVRTRLSAAALRTSRRAARPFSSSSQRPEKESQPANDPNPNPRQQTPNVSKTNEVAVDAMGAFDNKLQESAGEGERKRQLQSPNREGIWSRSQMPRELAMTGPRFEQTIMDAQPRPLAAIELIHQQPVRWVNTKSVACDGGGGPLGHPKIFINVDKPKICWCTYCGLPYAHTHHKKYLETLKTPSYPLRPTGNPAQVQMPQTPSQMGEIEGQYPKLKGELDAAGGAFSQR